MPRSGAPRWGRQQGTHLAVIAVFGQREETRASGGARGRDEIRSMYKVIMKYPSGETEELDEVFESESEATTMG